MRFITLSFMILLCYITQAADWNAQWTVLSSMDPKCCYPASPVITSQNGTQVTSVWIWESSPACTSGGIAGTPVVYTGDVGTSNTLPMAFNVGSLSVLGTFTNSGSTASFDGENGCSTLFTKNPPTTDISTVDPITPTVTPITPTDAPITPTNNSVCVVSLKLNGAEIAQETFTASTPESVSEDLAKYGMDTIDSTAPCRCLIYLSSNTSAEIGFAYMSHIELKSYFFIEDKVTYWNEAINHYTLTCSSSNPSVVTPASVDVPSVVTPTSVDVNNDEPSSVSGGSSFGSGGGGGGFSGGSSCIASDSCE